MHPDVLEQGCLPGGLWTAYSLQVTKERPAGLVGLAAGAAVLAQLQNPEGETLLPQVPYLPLNLRSLVATGD